MGDPDSGRPIEAISRPPIEAISRPPIEAVVLDMDGLLIDTEPVWRAAETEVFGELGIQLTETDMLATMGRRIVELAAHWRHHRPWPGAQTGEPSDAAIGDRVVDRMVAHVRSSGEPMPGVVGAVGLLRRLALRLAIASSSPHRLIDAVCERLGLGWIEVRCSADDVARGKPAGDVYLSAARRLELSPTLCLAVEDSPNGVLAARAAGMRCIAVPDRFLADDPRYGEADLVLRSLGDLDEGVLRSLGWRGKAGGRGGAGAG
jgi:sugar-phosphatase